ncbi:MAG TPA: AgmX/PglI C-terminal domain-containing protein [Kofleriaceae bacterium]|jgi:TonB family protein|nr:AgmX/PglI C-terminal domain-containing protein [Kofleriaceae bacterium]
MMRMSSWLAASVLAIAACGGTARGLEAYREDTGKLLETRNAQLQSCYGDALKSDAKLSGTVTVQFVVEKKTGTVTQASVDQSKSTAPAVLGDCVVKAVDGLTLAPPDRNEGRATFVYEFKPNPAPAS